MFLFGAGAEVPLGMPCGEKFFDLFLKQEKEVLDVLSKIYCETDDIPVKIDLITGKNKLIYAQTVYENEKEFKKLNLILENYKAIIDETTNVSDAIYTACMNKVLNGDISEKDKNIFNRFVEVCKKSLGLSKEDKLLQDSALTNFLKHNLKVCQALDEKFNSLRLEKFDNRANQVINTYRYIHYCIVKAMNEGKNINSSEDLLLSFWVKTGQHLGEESYYSIIQNLLSSKVSNAYYATTNYTTLIENFFSSKNISFLNGKVTWFENPQTLQVYEYDGFDSTMLKIIDLFDKQNRIIKNCFPFIMLPSGVKPIVAPIQIKQYHNFMKNLTKCNKLIVIGYNFNNDDNHINAIIADWLRGNSNHKLISFKYCEDEIKDEELVLQVKTPWMSEGKMGQRQIIPLYKDFRCNECSFKEKLEELLR